MSLARPITSTLASQCKRVKVALRVGQIRLQPSGLNIGCVYQVFHQCAALQLRPG